MYIKFNCISVSREELQIQEMFAQKHALIEPAAIISTSIKQLQPA